MKFFHRKNGYGHWNGNYHDKRCLWCTPWSLWKYVFQMWIERRIWKYIWIMALYNLWICLKVMEGGVCILGAIQHYLTYFNQSTTYKCKECENKSQWKNHGKSIWNNSWGFLLFLHFHVNIAKMPFMLKRMWRVIWK